jgi:hypothetical protein
MKLALVQIPRTGHPQFRSTTENRNFKSWANPPDCSDKIAIPTKMLEKEITVLLTAIRAAVNKHKTAGILITHRVEQIRRPDLTLMYRPDYAVGHFSRKKLSRTFGPGPTSTPLWSRISGTWTNTNL